MVGAEPFLRVIDPVERVLLLFSAIEHPEELVCRAPLRGEPPQITDHAAEFGGRH